MSRSKFSDEIKQEILSKSDRMTAKELAKEYGSSRSFVLKLWMDNDYHKPPSFKYYVNQDYFKEINTAKKAYFLGFISADGCVYKREKHQGLLSISIQKRDDEMLKQMIVDMDSTHHLLYRSNYCALAITSDSIYQDLLNLGVSQRKSWSIRFNDIVKHVPNEFIRDYIRGYFDGNGCISKTEGVIQSKVAVSIVTNIWFLEEMGEYLNGIGLTCSVKEDTSGQYSDRFGALNVIGTTNKYSFLNYLYKDSEIYLERKYNRYLEYKDKVDKNYTNRSENRVAVIEYDKFKKQLAS